MYSMVTYLVIGIVCSKVLRIDLQDSHHRHTKRGNYVR